MTPPPGRPRLRDGIARSRLVLELLPHRHGWLPFAAILPLAMAAWLQLAAIPRLEERATTQRNRLAALAAEAQSAASGAATSPPSLILERHQAFRSRLAGKESLPGIVRTLFAQARQAGLVLQKMDYRLQRPAGSDYAIYELSAPIQGSYAQIYQFAQGVLSALPAAALEDISFRRDRAGSASIQAKLHFAIYLKSDS